MKRSTNIHALLLLSCFALGCAALACLSLGIATPARADFVDTEVGARAQSMGGAFVAMSGDPASLFWNPAAIVSGEYQIQVEGMRTRVFDGVAGLNEDFVGVIGQPARRLAVGVGWVRTGLEDIYNEDLISVTGAYDVLDGRLAVGASALFYGAEAPGYEALNDPNYEGAQWESSVSLGLLFRLRETWQFGASFENLLRPEIQLVSTSTDIQEIGGRRRFGASYLLQEMVYISFEARHHDVPEYINGDWTLHAGAESWFQEVLALRAGIDDGDLTAGAGLAVSKARIDVGLISHERLGNSYRASLNLRF